MARQQKGHPRWGADAAEEFGAGFMVASDRKPDQAPPPREAGVPGEPARLSSGERPARRDASEPPNNDGRKQTANP